MIDRILGALPHYPEGHFASGPSFQKYYDKSFALGPEQLRQLVQTMSEGVRLEFPESPQSFEISGTTRTGGINFLNLDELLSYSNESSAKLGSVSLAVRPANRAMATVVEFKDHVPGWSTAVVVEGGDENTSRGLFEHLKDHVKPTFQWYSFLLNSRFWSSLLIACLVIYVVSFFTPQLFRAKLPGLAPAHGDVSAQQDLGGDSSQVVSIIGESPRKFVIGVTVFCVIGVLLGFELIPHVFPKGAFLLGQGAARYRRITMWRYVLLIALMVPLGFSIYRALS